MILNDSSNLILLYLVEKFEGSNKIKFKLYFNNSNLISLDPDQ